MHDTRNTWAVVLAAGEGTRLAELTTEGGARTPKQFWSLRGGRSLLGDALLRAARIAPRKRIVVVVAAEHRGLFERDVAGLPPENVVVQPANRGTAAGILLPALTVIERDPRARIAFLPSDHFVAREHLLESTLRFALESLDEAGGGPTLLGITPDAPETGYGWIVPARGTRMLRPIASFVEKPERRVAEQLFAAGALWNSFLLAVDGMTLLRLYAERLPLALADFHAAFGRDEGRRAAELEALYARLEPADFSRDLLQGRDGLTLAAVPPCGWTDLGTPERVAACLAGIGHRSGAPERGGPPAAFDLADALDRMLARRAATALSA